MIPKGIDLSKSSVGTIIGFEEGAGRTGYRVKMLIRSKEAVFDVTEEVFRIRDTTEFFPYPCLGEVLFLPQFNSDGILTYFINVNDITVANNPIKTGLVMGTYAMFTKKIDERTPKFGEILTLVENGIKLTNYDAPAANGTICHSVFAGAITPRDGFVIPMASDADVYTWDWSASLAPFSRCTREEAEARKYVTRMSAGVISDVLDGYWVGFYSTRGHDSVCDLVKCFKNKAPGWE